MGRIGFVFLFMCIILAGCKGEEAVTTSVPELLKPASLDMDTVTVKKDVIYNIEIHNAQVVPFTEELSFGSSGTIGKINVSIGDKVKKGQLLCELMESDFKQELKEKKNLIKESKKAYNDQNALSEYDITILKEELKQLNKELKEGKEKEKKKQLELNIKEKESDIKIAKKKLVHDKEQQKLEIDKLQSEYNKLNELGRFFEIRSGINGDVAVIDGAAGVMVNAGVTVVAVADNEKPMIKSPFINKADIGKCDRAFALHNDKEYEIVQQDYDADEIDAKVERGEQVYAYFSFKEKPENVKVGDFIVICMIRDYVEDALTIPANALFKDGDNRYVYLVEGQTKTKQEVSLGTVTPAYVQIKDGLQEGDVVYVQR